MIDQTLFYKVFTLDENLIDNPNPTAWFEIEVRSGQKRKKAQSPNTPLSFLSTEFAQSHSPLGNISQQYKSSR